MRSIEQDFQDLRDGPWNDIQDHMQFMHDTVLGYEYPVVIECGVRTGNSTAALLSATVKAGGHMWSCDINSREAAPYPYPEEWTGIPEWTFVAGDSVAPETLRQMPRECDVLFLDTSHTYDQTLAELRAYVPLVKKHGIVLLHDTQLSGNAELQIFSNLPDVGGPVAEALDTYCAETGLTWENRHSVDRWYGMGIIRL